MPGSVGDSPLGGGRGSDAPDVVHAVLAAPDVQTRDALIAAHAALPAAAASGHPGWRRRDGQHLPGGAPHSQAVRFGAVRETTRAAPSRCLTAGARQKGLVRSLMIRGLAGPFWWAILGLNQ